jgi:hypothetical protein
MEFFPTCPANREPGTMTVTTLLSIGSLLLVLAAIPTSPYGKAWGYRPSGFFSAMALIAILLALTGHA